MDIDSFLTQLETDITDTVVNDCKQVVEEKFHNNSNKIYDEYIPWSSYGKQYKRRRENGGYGDKDNISTQIINNGNGDITLLTSNDTKGLNKKFLDIAKISKVVNGNVIEKVGKNNGKE